MTDEERALENDPSVIGWSKREGDPMVVERRQATMPEQRTAPTIESMRVGETVWAVPWALVVDSKRRCWLRPGYTVSADPGGTADMGITRASYGYVVNIAGCDHKWDPIGDADRLSYIRVDTLETR